MSLKETYRSVGYAQYTLTTATAKKLTDAPGSGVSLPTDNDKRPRRITITVETQGIRWRDDGTAPTAGIGMPAFPGDSVSYDGDFAAFQFIEQASGAVVNITYHQ